MKSHACALLLAAVFVPGCAGTMSSPLPPDQTIAAKCKALESAPEAGVQPPKLVKKEKAVSGLILGSGGSACVRATVTPHGKLAEPEILETDNRTFADAFVRSLRGSVYEPARKDGAPVPFKVVLTGWWSDAGLPDVTPESPATGKPDEGR
jgi:hypothetical protein